MGPFLLGFLIAAIVGLSLVYNCYNKREQTERKLKQNISNLEHNLRVLQKENELRIEQLTVDLKKAKDENRKSMSTIEIMQRELDTLKTQLEECQEQLEDL